MNWFGPFRDFDPPGTTDLGADLTNDLLASPQAFYRGAGITYPAVPVNNLQFAQGDRLLIGLPTMEQALYTFDPGGLTGTWATQNTSGTFFIRSQQTTGPFKTTLIIDHNNGAFFYLLNLYLDLDYATNGLAQPSRFDGGVIQQFLPPVNIPILDPNQLFPLAPGWRYLPAP
jgi:hypothetical protein